MNDNTSLLAKDSKSDFPFFTDIQTRWNDNDIYGHVNNMVYYAYFDTVVNNYLIHQGRLDIQNGAVVGVVVESFCQYRQSFTYPERIVAGMRVGKLGRSSVRYELGLFSDAADSAHAIGYFTHVFVTRESNQSCDIPPSIREELEKLRC